MNAFRDQLCDHICGDGFRNQHPSRSECMVQGFIGLLVTRQPCGCGPTYLDYGVQSEYKSQQTAAGV